MSRSGFEPFVLPESPAAARVAELQRQNDLLREANAVLKQALVGVVDRYKKLAESIPPQQRNVTGASRDIYDERADSPNRVRSLEDITTNVIQAVVSRFAEPSPERLSPSRGGSVAKAMKERERLMEVRNIIRSVELEGEPKDLALPCVSSHSERDTHIAHVNNRSLGQGSSVASPAKLGEESRILREGSPSIFL